MTGPARFTRIEIRQAEGLIGQLKSGIFFGPNAESQADRLLQEIAATAPMGGSYYKVDVQSTYEIDGASNTYRARHDVSRFDTDGMVRGHIIRHLTYVWEHDDRSTPAQREEAARLVEAFSGKSPKKGGFPWVDEFKRQREQGSGPLGRGVLPTIRQVVKPVPLPVPPSSQLGRDEAIRRIREGLRRRSGKAWSVTGGRGTAWGWIRITSPPSKRDKYGKMTDEDRTLLAKLLGLEIRAHEQGVSIPSSSDYYAEYVDRADGRPPSKYGRPYWD